ncbi:AbrB/MazE/SpoVT family DNA-binding domain-containing protein [Candidatus Roizmanbacteria bacterium]|nr:AbrB/MazE/SpoVT family DNA-binding domain-containing protein [Candidatus Roizmanbacteria bacterium]
MTYTVTITSQGQISLPIQIRRELGFSKTKKALVSVENGKVIIEAVKDILELGGSLHTTKKPLTSHEIHEFVAKSVAEQLKK